MIFFFFSSRRRHTRFDCDWSSDVCSSDLLEGTGILHGDRAHAARPAILRRRTTLGELAQQPWELDEILTRLARRVTGKRSEERRVGKECRYRGSPYH